MYASVSLFLSLSLSHTHLYYFYHGDCLWLIVDPHMMKLIRIKRGSPDNNKKQNREKQ